MTVKTDHARADDSRRFIRSGRGNEYLGASPAQLRVLSAIAELTAACGYCPTVREIGFATGIRSTNGVTDHLRRLQSKGLVTFATMKTRTIRLTEAGIAEVSR